MNDKPADEPVDRASLLVVDDEEPLLQIFQEFFEGREYDLTIARTGEQALESLSTSSFDLVVTDLNLPGVDGLAVLQSAKGQDPELEVIVLTGNASTLTAIEALRQGAYDYVLKPFDLYEMEQTVQKALERRRLLAENRKFVTRLERHRDELREEVEKATRRIRTLYEIGKEITSTLDLDHTLSLILERSVDLTGTERGLLFLLNEGTGELDCGVSQGFRAGSEERAGHIDHLGDANREALTRKQPVIAELPSPGGEPLTALVVPLLQESGATGTIAVLSDKGGGFSGDDQSLLVNLASQASIAINNARVYGKIQALDRMKSEFVAVVSHEVRTPLTAIKGTLEILGDSQYFEIPAPQLELLQICQTNVERLETLINDILDFSKLESSRLSTHFVRAHLDSLLESVIVNLGNVAEKAGITIRIQIAPDLPAVEADELRVSQVMSNLLSNAIKFSHQGETIEVRARAEDGGVVVEIEDRGIGIAQDDLPKLFTKFRQLDSSSTRKTGGTGLGLAISKGIVEEHNGRIWVESRRGQGSCFSFWLPASHVEAPADRPSPESSRPSVA
jgi:signal transduction histidine kinase/DNA-binding response OmpR family regulator